MTHPLTPRKKVEYWLSLAMDAGLHKQDFNLTEATDAIVTALASGSGDQLSGNPGILKSGEHAELARLADMADWMADGDPGANGSVLLSASVASEHASDLKGLLAEIAALRAEAGLADVLGEKLERRTFALDEAERKLAEAEGVVRLLFESFPKTKPRESDESEPFALRTARTFLSKEAERG